jgi:hypothetical protein
MRNTGIRVLLVLLSMLFTRVGTAYADSGRHFELVDNTWYALDGNLSYNDVVFHYAPF